MTSLKLSRHYLSSYEHVKAPVQAIRDDLTYVLHSLGDLAFSKAEDIDWGSIRISYKNGEWYVVVITEDRE